MSVDSEAALEKLRRALRETSGSEPRPLASFELPLGMQRLLSPARISRLRPAAVLIPVIDHNHEPTVLLTRRSAALRKHGGQISFPGGARDAEDAGAWETALRETREEVGLDTRYIERIGYLDDYPTITGYRITPVVGVVRPPLQLRLEPREVDEAFEVPLSFLLDRSSFQRRILSREGVNVPFFELHHGGRRIWGATAGILWNLYDKVHGDL